jgi:hypothetical protein
MNSDKAKKDIQQSELVDFKIIMISTYRSTHSDVKIILGILDEFIIKFVVIE